MRVTNNMMINSLMHNLDKNLSRMSDNQNHLNSGHRVNKASDDPIDASKILKFKTDISEFEQYGKNVRDALSWYEVSESSVAEVGEVLQRARELSVKAANEVNTPDDLKKIGAEIENLTQQLISSGNFNFAGKYIFSGYQTDKKLFKDDGSYNIDITQTEYSQPPKMSLLVGTGEDMQITTSGLDVFGMVEGATAFSRMFTDSAGDQMIQDKSAVKGRLDLTQSLATKNLDVVFNGATYNVNETGLLGTTATPIDKSVLIDRFKNALDGANKLGDVADIYFDSNDNLVIEAKAKGNIAIAAASNDLKVTKLFTGSTATKSTLTGAFALDGPSANYAVQNLDVNLSGIGTFIVDEATLNGQSFTIDKNMVVEQLSKATLSTDPTKQLSDYADIYFDANNELVIKDKRYGNNTLSLVAPPPGYTPTLTTGRATQEASVGFSQFTFSDADIAADAAELKASPIYITFNGERKAIQLDPAAVINTAVGYQTELQNSIDAAFGSGKVAVNLNGVAPNQSLSFNTVATQSGALPSLRVETIKTKTASLIEDMKAFHSSLMTGNRAGIQDFLGKIDQHLNRVIAVRADIGAKVSRMELIKNRLSANNVSFTGMLSKAQDVDMAKEIMILKNAENVYRASLSTGSKVIQPTLVDFLR